MRHVVICGAGFGGLELSTQLADHFPDEVSTTLIDASDSFVFGFSKLDVLFGRKTLDEVRIPYRSIAKPGVDFRQERITSIDPQTRRVTTTDGTYDADILVIALGADYDIDATPGLREAGEFYSVEGAQRLAPSIDSFAGGRAVIGICGPFFKCPPAPFEAALLLDGHARERGIRDSCEIGLWSPLPMPIPVSVPTSEAIVRKLNEHGISSTFGELVVSVDPDAKVAHLKSGGTVDYDLFLGIPKHVAPEVLTDSGLLTDGWIAVDKEHLSTSFENVYAVGDVATAPTPRAGVFAEGQAKAAFADIAAKITGSGEAPSYDGRGICYMEVGGGLVAKVDTDFLGGPKPVAVIVDESVELAREKELFGSTRRGRWFGTE
jgi:sulfide:quinone oxidoreductase